MPLDPHIDAYLRRLSSAAAPLDLQAQRAATEAALRALQGPLEPVAAIETHIVPGHGGHPLRVRAYTPNGATPGAVLPALVYAHGGGWFQCSLEVYDHPCRCLLYTSMWVVSSLMTSPWLASMPVISSQ